MVKLIIEGMTCGHCVQHVKRAIANIAGVTSVEVTLHPGEAIVEGHASNEALIAAIEAEGYQARIVHEPTEFRN